jgi:hypothetical protein
MWYDNGTAYKGCWVEYASTTTVRFVIASVITSSLFANGDGMKFNFRGPIKGW